MRKYFLWQLFVAVSLFSKAQTVFKVTDSFSIGSAGGWDYLAIQPNSDRLFVSHGTQVNVLDKTKGDSLGVIPNTIGVHGIAFVPSLQKGYTSNGKLNNVFVFDLNTLVVTDSIRTGKNPDAIFYDAYSKRIFTCNGGSKDVSVIDPGPGKVVAVIPVGGKPETAVSDNNGKIFVNIEDRNEVVVIDAEKMQVTAHWSLAPGEAPTGLAIDIQTKRLFAACGDNDFLIVLNAETGEMVDKITIGKNCDGASFDPVPANIYTSNGEGTITVIHEDSKDKYHVVATVPVKKGCRTITVDPVTHTIYTPTADFLPKVQQKRPKMIPGTFKVFVVNQQ